MINAVLASFATGGSLSPTLRLSVLIGMALVNSGLYMAAFRSLTPSVIRSHALIPGATVAAIGFTFLITLGSGLVQHQLRHSSTTYGQFGIVIGLVAFLLLLAKVSLYGAEFNPVVARTLWPRGLQRNRPTEADDQVLRDITHQNLRRADQWIGVGFRASGRRQVVRDAETSRPDTGFQSQCGEESAAGGTAEDTKQRL
ncbi:MAG: YhjD/YihY/BrkB family envelope integrity protein [Acidimicrobiales bacterium]